MKHEFSIVVIALALLGGDGADTITGSKGHDLIIGGDSADTFFWSGGNDHHAEFARSAA